MPWDFQPDPFAVRAHGSADLQAAWGHTGLYISMPCSSEDKKEGWDNIDDGGFHLRQEYFNEKGEPVGYSESGIYYTERKSWAHFFVLFRGYGISMTILSQLWANGVKLVCLKERRKDGTFKVWLSYLGSWYKWAHNWTDEGHRQKILPLTLMWDEGCDPPKEVLDSLIRLSGGQSTL